MSLLEVHGLEVFFDLPDGELHAIQGVDFSLDAGERLGVVGESGAGKSSMILAIMGLLPPNASIAGQVLLDGQDLLTGGERGCDSWRWRQIATVFQGAMNAFNPVRTIGWQIAEPMAAHGTATGAMARARARELLSLTGLPPGTERAYPHELSGGMRQRAAIAMALACQPKVLLADEPTTALDVIVQDGILKMLTELTDELGLAMILVTHDLAAATATCTKMAVMYAGRIVEEASVGDLSAAPEHPYTRQLFAATPSLRGGEAVKAIPGVPPRLDVPIAGCPFGPRCEVSFERCHDELPALTTIADGWRSACHRSHAGSGLRAVAAGQAGLGGAAGVEIASLDVRTATAVASASLTREVPQVLAAPAVLPYGALADAGPALRLDNVFVSFPRRRSAAALIRGKPRPVVRAVDGLSLEVAPGELVALVGESGSGKTSTANSIVGNARLTAGDISIAGQRVADMDRRDRRLSHRQVQLVYQDPYESLDPRKRVRSILDEPLRVNKIGRGRAERRQLAASALAQVGLDPPDLYTSRYPHELSGGQRQRVAIAAALVMGPSIIIADEPVSMLDVSIRAEVLDVFDGLRRSLSVAVVMITHDLSIAAHYADRIAVMYLGRIVELGPAADVIGSPRHPYTKALIAAVPSASPGGDRASVLPGEIPDGAAIPPGCRFHPRCPVALASCSSQDPDFVTVSSGHSAACVLAT